MRLTNFDIDDFLRRAWQKEPVLIRGGWDAWCNPLDPDELAGLACEPGIESRLVTQAPDRWELEHGPLSEQRFADLRELPWTLLVQAVDHHVPAVAALLEPFRFIPNWRVDDVMVSYAVDGGGVGAHFDQYDVFLVQGLGRRRWQIGAQCDGTAELLPHDDLRLLANFTPTEEWVLEPGDILYVPPGFPHNGIAVGDDCMTYSIGFRAPSRAELVSGWAEYVVAGLDDNDRYCDPDLSGQENPGEISREAQARLLAMVAEKMSDAETFAHWFGEYCTTPKSQDIDWRPDEPIGLDEVRSGIAAGAPLLRNPASRFSFVRGEAGALTLFVDGRSYPCTGRTAEFAERLCAHQRFDVAQDLSESTEALALIVKLASEGCVTFELGD